MSSEPLRVVIAGGGTGGHLYPGIAVAREFLARQASTVISFAGTQQGIESRVIPREGFPLDVIRSSGLKGKGLLDRGRGAARLPLSMVDAWRVVSSRRPHLVIGVGGYSSGPIVLASALRGVPTMLLEQNAVPGLTNRLLSRVVRAAAVTYEATKEFFGSKAFVSGNPVRREFFGDGQRATEARTHDTRSGIKVLVFGGSQGAHAINVAMVEAAAQLAARLQGLRLTHQTGERDVDMVRSAYQSAGIAAEVAAFLYDMPVRLADTDVVVCRAGATTLAEISAARKASILIPLPTATDDHQRKNAEVLASHGAAEVLLQADASGDALAGRIVALADNVARRTAMAVAAGTLARPDAAKAIVDRAMELTRAR